MGDLEGGLLDGLLTGGHEARAWADAVAVGPLLNSGHLHPKSGQCCSCTLPQPFGDVLQVLGLDQITKGDLGRDCLADRPVTGPRQPIKVTKGWPTA
eukprot:1145002-Pelagomonas_calceolata.AAC.4